jgi:hypothetical protein
MTERISVMESHSTLSWMTFLADRTRSAPRLIQFSISIPRFNPGQTSQSISSCTTEGNTGFMRDLQQDLFSKNLCRAPPTLRIFYFASSFVRSGCLSESAAPAFLLSQIVGGSRSSSRAVLVQMFPCRPSWVPKNLVHGATYFKWPADQGYDRCQYECGRCFQYGHVVLSGLSGAAEYYRLPAEQGNADSQNAEGHCLHHGIGAPYDVVKAAEYFRSFADRCNNEVQQNYVMCLENGIGLSVNMLISAEYFRLSADQGNPVGQLVCGCFFEQGMDLVASAEYYRMSGM